MTWLPSGFVHPERVELATGHHLRPIREADVDIDYPAVMGSRERLWAKYGAAWGWPPATMTYEEDRLDLARHEAEIAAHETFNYAVLDAEETELLGCVYIDPADETSRREVTPWRPGGWSTRRSAAIWKGRSTTSSRGGWPRPGDSGRSTTIRDPSPQGSLIHTPSGVGLINRRTIPRRTTRAPAPDP